MPGRFTFLAWPVMRCLRVVKAVDGVRLQTSESIGCAEELGLPAVVALNKIDLLQQEEAAQVTDDHVRVRRLLWRRHS